MRRISVMLVLAASLSAPAAAPPQANNALGPLYPVAEPDLLHVIEAAAQTYIESGQAKADLQHARQRAAAYVADPSAGARVARVQRSAIRMFDPSITLEADMLDANGNVLHAAGTRVNPLAHSKLTARLVLFDGTDPIQYAFAAALARGKGKTYPVLVAGSPVAFMRATGLRAYFDQQGSISKRLAIDAYPAIVSQAQDMLQIESIRLKQQ